MGHPGLQGRKGAQGFTGLPGAEGNVGVPGNPGEMVSVTRDNYSVHDIVLLINDLINDVG